MVPIRWFITIDRSTITDSLRCMRTSRLPWLVLLVAGLTFSGPHFAWAGNLNQTPVPALVEQAKKALIEQDEKKFKDVSDHLFERVTGFPATTSQIPEDLSDEDYIKRMCAYTEIIEPVFTQELLDVMRHQSALMAYSTVLDGTENDITIRGITDCTHEDGRPLATAQFMRDGIAWAKTFQSANAAQAQAMAQGVQARAEQNPQIRELAILAKLVGYHAQDKQDARHQKPANNKHVTPTRSLVSKAHKGDLTSQMELARRLETGDHASTKIPSAYFWYERARKNGGGEAAQAGLNRLLPKLSQDDLWRVDLWGKRNVIPPF